MSEPDASRAPIGIGGCKDVVTPRGLTPVCETLYELTVREADNYLRALLAARWPRDGLRWWNKFERSRGNWLEKEKELYGHTPTGFMVDHGREHAEALYSSLPRFLWAVERTRKQQNAYVLDNPAELYALMAAAYLHDIGNNDLGLNEEFALAARRPGFPFLTPNLTKWLTQWQKAENDEQKNWLNAGTVRKLHPEIGAWICLRLFNDRAERAAISQVVLRHAKHQPKEGLSPETIGLEGDAHHYEIRIGLISSLIAIADACQIGGHRARGVAKQLVDIEGRIRLLVDIVETPNLRRPLHSFLVEHLKLLRNQPLHLFKHAVVSYVSMGPAGLIVVPAMQGTDKHWFAIQQEELLRHGVRPELCSRRHLIQLACKDISGELKKPRGSRQRSVKEFLEEELWEGVVPEVPLISCRNWPSNKERAAANDEAWRSHLSTFHDPCQLVADPPSPVGTPRLPEARGTNEWRKTGRALVPPLLLQELDEERYVVPRLEGTEFSAVIEGYLDAGRNVLLEGKSGLGKSLLMAYCYLRLWQGRPSCFCSIDLTEGPTGFETTPVLRSLREQLQSLPGITPHAPSRGPVDEPAWQVEKREIERLLYSFSRNGGKPLLVFLDALDENVPNPMYEKKTVLEALRNLILHPDLNVRWVLSSQPQDGLESVRRAFEVLPVLGVGEEEAEDLLRRNLPPYLATLHSRLVQEMLRRSLLETGRYDPEMLVVLGRAITERIPNVVPIRDSVMPIPLDSLPMDYRYKYTWLFDQYTCPGHRTNMLILKENSEKWRDVLKPFSYPRFLLDVLCVLSLTRMAIPVGVLAWALGLKDSRSRKDVRGNNIGRYDGYPEEALKDGSLWQTAVADLGRLLRIVGPDDGGSLSFSKETVREAFMKYADARHSTALPAARARLANLGWVAVTGSATEARGPEADYLTGEWAFLLSLDRDTWEASCEDITSRARLPELLQQGALRRDAWTGLPHLLSDLHLLEETCSSEEPATRLRGVREALYSRQFQLNPYPELIAEFIRASRGVYEPPSRNERHRRLLMPAVLPGSESWADNLGYLPPYTGHADDVTCLAVMRDGRLASGSKDGTIRLWDLRSGDVRVLSSQTPPGPTGKPTDVEGILCLGVLDDGRLVSGGDAGTVRLWDTETGASKILPGHDEEVTCLAVLNSGLIVTASPDCTVQVLDPDSEAGVPLQVHYVPPVYCLDVLRDGRIICGGVEHNLVIIDTKQGGEIDSSRIEGLDPEVSWRGVTCLAVVDENRVAVGTDEGILLYDVKEDRFNEPLPESCCISEMTVSSRGTLWTTQGNNGWITEWDLIGGDWSCCSSPVYSPLYCLGRFVELPEGDVAMTTGGRDIFVCVTDSNRMDCGIRCLCQRSGRLLGVSPGGRLVLHVPGDEYHGPVQECGVDIIDLKSGNAVRLAYTGDVSTGCISAEGTVLLGDSDGCLSIWRDLEHLGDHAAPDTVIAMLESYPRPEVEDINIRFRDVCGRAETKAIEISADRVAVASPLFDGKIKIHVLHGEEESELHEEGCTDVSQMVPLSDSRLAVLYRDEVIRVWDTENTSVVKAIRACGVQRGTLAGYGERRLAWACERDEGCIAYTSVEYGTVSYLGRAERPANGLAWVTERFLASIHPGAQTLSVWDVAERCERFVGFLSSRPEQVFFNPCEKMLVVGTAAGYEVFPLPTDM